MTLGVGDVKPATAKSAILLQWDSKQGEALSLRFDVVTSVNAEDTVDISDHPVEEGADVTDHARTKLARLTIEAITSLSPNPVNDPNAVQVLAGQNVAAQVRVDGGDQHITLNIPAPPLQFSESGLIQGGIGALKSALLGQPKALVKNPTVVSTRNALINVITRDASFSRTRAVYSQLLDLKDEHTLVHIVTLHREYSNMMIERLASPRAVGDGSNIKFQIDFKEIRTVSSLSVKAPKPTEPRAQKPVSGGSKNPKPDPSPVQHVSLLQQVGNALGKF